MDRGMQAVPVLVEGGSQTQLTHPKNVYVQYESRAFSKEELTDTFTSTGFKSFLNQAEELFNDVQQQGDIMGGLRTEVESFYMRDYVEEKVETRLIEHLSLSDLVFSRQKRVKDVRWHPRLGHVVGMACLDNLNYDQYIDRMSQRILSPNYLMIWSTLHFIYPQLLLRAPDDVTVFQWHPTQDGSLLAGLGNGQLILWDLSPYMEGLEQGQCTWDHRKLNCDQDQVDWNEEAGFIPVLEWSAESSLLGGHQEEVSDIQWLPATIKFDQESAFPKENPGDAPVQFISCARENFLLVWQIDTEDMMPQETASLAQDPKKLPKKGAGKEQSAPAVRTKVGRFSHLNEKWKPLYKLNFREPGEEEELAQLCIQGFVVLDRPELAEEEKAGSPRGSPRVEVDEGEEGGEELREEEDPGPLIKAIPTFILVGTLQGGVFRANLASCSITVDTGDLVCTMEWYKVSRHAHQRLD